MKESEKREDDVVIEEVVPEASSDVIAMGVDTEFVTETVEEETEEPTEAATEDITETET